MRYFHGMLKMSKSFVVRMSLWSTLILYLICDFFFFNGPLKQELRRLNPTEQDRIEHAVAQGICAKVFNGPIFLGQVDRRVEEKLYRSGRELGKISGNELEILRWAALDELIDEHLLRVKTKVNVSQVNVSDQEIKTELKRFTQNFASEEDLNQALSEQGIESRDELRYRIIAQIQQEQYVESMIKDYFNESQKTARELYDKNIESLTVPERRQVRHVFIATLDTPSEEAQLKLGKQLQSLQEGQIDFKKLALTVSEDAHSKTRGGDLGWLTQKRIPGDFSAAIFSTEMNSPSLIRTKLGWHIIEVTGIQPPTLPPFEELENEILTDLVNSKRADAVKQYRHQLRLVNKDQIQLFPQAMKFTSPEKIVQDQINPNQNHAKSSQ